MSKCLVCGKRLKKGRDYIVLKTCKECEEILSEHRVDLTGFVKPNQEDKGE